MLDDKHFEKTMPACIFICYLIQVTFILVFRVEGEGVRSPASNKPRCTLDYEKELNIFTNIGFTLQALYDIGISVFFLYLFGKPLFQLSRKKMSGSSRNVLSNFVAFVFFFCFFGCYPTPF